MIPQHLVSHTELQSDTSGFQANQSLLLLLSAACGEETNTNFIVIGLTRRELKHAIYWTQGEFANHYYTTDVVR